MSSPKKDEPRNFGTRLPELIEQKISESRLPITSNYSAFTRAAVDNFIAQEFQIIPTRELTFKLNTKVSKERQTRSLSINPKESRHWRRVCRAHAKSDGLKKPYSIAALIINAYARYFALI